MSKELKAYTFFAMNNFEKEGGGTIRMYGILNALASKGHLITFISNAKDYSKFDDRIQHVPINYSFSPEEKRKFQFQLSFFSISFVNYLNSEFYTHIKNVLKDFSNDSIYFFEYLDNSIGYWLYKNKLINDYINDLHGVASLEFKFQMNNKNSLKEKTLLFLKNKTSIALDKKVLCNAAKNIFASNAMRDYYINLYPELKNTPYTILPYLLPHNVAERKADVVLLNSLKERYGIAQDNKVILFAGTFKLTGGVLGLIKAFEKVIKNHPMTKLLLIGDGYEYENCTKYVNVNQIPNIYFIGRTPYNHLPTYQELADILVCPDTDNVFSQLIIHVKYLDALITNKPVINGNFKSVLEINHNENLSLGYKPSDIDDFSKTIERALINVDIINEYQNNRSYVLNNLTYSSWKEEI